MKCLYSILIWLAFGGLVAWFTILLFRPVKPRRTYAISPDAKSIICLRCGRTSYHPEDVRQLYCGNCHRFHVR